MVGVNALASVAPPAPSPTQTQAESGTLGTLASVRARGAPRGRVTLLGPAFVIAVAFVDPGNVATNFAAGAATGYQLVWVVAAANLMAMLVQYLSAKLGLATGRSLPELCRDRAPAWLVVPMWVQAELVAMATDLAEFVGAALGLSLLFGMPIRAAAPVTAAIAFAVLAAQRRGHRRFELAIGALLCLVTIGFAYDLLAAGHQCLAPLALGAVPRLPDGSGALLAVGIVGATLMPHVVYLHSALTRQRVRAADEDDRRRLLRYLRLDCGVGLGLAGLVNVGMLCLAVALFTRGPGPLDAITAAHDDLRRTVGGAAALGFAVALLASGVSSASVGTYAGQIVMQGFLRCGIPLTVRRAITMLPALVVLCLGLPVTQTLLASQVVLCFGIPFALVPLVALTRRRELMGTMVNRRVTTLAGALICLLVTALNAYLLATTFGG